MEYRFYDGYLAAHQPIKSADLLVYHPVFKTSSSSLDGDSAFRNLVPGLRGKKAIRLKRGSIVLDELKKWIDDNLDAPWAFRSTGSVVELYLSRGRHQVEARLRFAEHMVD